MPKDKATYSIELEKDMMWFLEQMTTEYRSARRVENRALSGELCPRCRNGTRRYFCGDSLQYL